MKYRKWQERGIETARNILSNTTSDMSVAAGVGSGKTFLAANIADISRDLRGVRRIIVITINRRCQRQWAATMKKQKLPLLRLRGNSALKDGLPPDVLGYITTYASVGMFPDVHAAFCGGEKTTVIFDEIHHLNDSEDTKWGKAARDAFDSAEFILCLSGTFFSSNGAAIPFAEMKPKEGANDIFVYDPQVIYSYGESVADKICRRAIFKPFDGPIEYKRDDDRDFFTATFADNIDEKNYGLRLWASGQTKGASGQPNNMLNEMLFRAHRQLEDLRTAGHTRAAGLILCDDKKHARAVCQVIQRISGHKAVLVLDDEPDSEEAINSFTHGFAPWMVAVKMVTEGVDIPRLRVGVFLANVTQKLTFVQFVGRTVRHFKGDDEHPADPAGECYIYYPGDSRLQAIAKEIEDEVQEAIDLKEKKKKKTGGDDDDDEAEVVRSKYQSGNVNGEERDNVVAGEVFGADEIETADKLRMQWPNLAETQILDMIKFVRTAKASATSPAPSPFDDNDEDHDELRKDCQKEAQRLARMGNIEFNEVHTSANKAVGINNINKASIEQLKAKRAWLREQQVIGFAK